MTWSELPTPVFMPPNKQDEITFVPEARPVGLPTAARALDIQPFAAHLVLQPFHFVLQFFLFSFELLLKVRLQFAL